MIPNEIQAKLLWDKYQLPEKKRIHMTIIADLAVFVANKLEEKNIATINIDLLRAGCLLHDIDKNIPRLSGESHPQTGVRVLKEEGLDEVASLIQYHSAHYISAHPFQPTTFQPISTNRHVPCLEKPRMRVMS
jgi:putative nucleotidyltransferase with HDIG domain